MIHWPDFECVATIFECGPEAMSPYRVECIAPVFERMGVAIRGQRGSRFSIPDALGVALVAYCIVLETTPEMLK